MIIPPYLNILIYIIIKSLSKKVCTSIDNHTHKRDITIIQLPLFCFFADGLAADLECNLFLLSSFLEKLSIRVKFLLSVLLEITKVELFNFEL